MTQGEGGNRGENKITVVIPNYNGRQFLSDCLMSLDAEQELLDTPAFEILVVDNGSTDGSVPLLVELWPQVKRILLSENTGFCHAVNEGIRAAVTPYVILLNNDTKVERGFIKGLYEAIEGNDKIFSASAQMRMWDKPELLDDAGDLYCVLGWAFARGKGRRAERYESPARIFSACGGAAIYRKCIFEEIGLFDETHFAYLEDLDIGYRARIFGYRNVYAPAAKVIHYGSASTGSRYNPRKTELSSANNVYVIWKNMPMLQLVWNLPFLLVGFLVKAVFFAQKGMGGLYLKGLLRGVRRIFSQAGRRHKVPFSLKHLKNYLIIQWTLYINTILLFL
ncbi:MAG: glycosyltransferase family 2 protein [Candidatus Gastranaerophilales bacterium]|nr:glycosyltransferase family 2 protein [Candidatus Gastranaerophilales bacterium]